MGSRDRVAGSRRAHQPACPRSVTRRRNRHQRARPGSDRTTTPYGWRDRRANAAAFNAASSGVPPSAAIQDVLADVTHACFENVLTLRTALRCPSSGGGPFGTADRTPGRLNPREAAESSRADLRYATGHLRHHLRTSSGVRCQVRAPRLPSHRSSIASVTWLSHSRQRG